MLAITRLRNPIQKYPWGSRHFLPELLGAESPSEEPWAELWMGAHPKAPSEVLTGGGWRPLRTVIETAPEQVLGAEVARRYDGELPFLFKLLAAEEALSIQAHPDRLQARRGCRREDELGLDRTAAQRSYRDAYHKPELLYALTPFRMLRGFRPPGQIFELFERLGLRPHLAECAILQDGDPALALEHFFTAFMSLPRQRIADVLEITLEGASRLAGSAEIFGEVLELARSFPGDRGVLAPLILNRIELQPGEAVFTGPGVLHAYLRGLGVELMANSDNVLRGGLTSKHIDVPELLRVLRFEPTAPDILTPNPVAAGVLRFEVPAAEFALTVLEVRPERPHHRAAIRGVEVLFCGAGSGTLEQGAGDLPFQRGDSFLVPAAAETYRLSGEATFYRAEVGAL